MAPGNLDLSLDLSTRAPGAGVRPPAGYAFIANTDGSYVTDANGNYKVRPL